MCVTLLATRSINVIFQNIIITALNFPAMIKHSLTVIEKAVTMLNPNQTSVVGFDQPLLALAKNVQWIWPQTQICYNVWGIAH